MKASAFVSVFLFSLWALLFILSVANSQTVNVKTNAHPPKTYAEHLAVVKKMLVSSTLGAK